VRVVIAPDSFKESLSAAGVAAALADGVRDALPDAEIVCVPMADGGEGSLDAVLDATGGARRAVSVRDANGRACEAAWAWLGEGKAFIEMAAAAGLERISPAERRPLDASSYGVGQLIGDALDAGATHIVIGLGGSATNDAGAGVLQALGVRLLDEHGAELPPGGAALARLERVDMGGVDARLSSVHVDIAVDVDNTLCGARGASAIFGPQKGATPEQVRQLDAALTHFADVCARQFGRDERDIPGWAPQAGWLCNQDVF